MDFRKITPVSIQYCADKKDILVGVEELGA